MYFGDVHFRVRIEDGLLDIGRGDAENSDLILDTDQTTLLSLLNPEGSVDDALSSHGF